MSFSYSAGVITQSNEASKSITAFASGGSNTLTISVSAHGYAVGNLVEIKNTSNYNGVYLITAVTTNTFNVSTFTVDDIENAFVVTETGTVERGDADNSGLFGLTDVDRDDSGKKYTISNSVIQIQGAWLLDSEINELVFSDTYTSPFCLITRKAGCFFQIGTKKKDNGNVAYSKGSAITTTGIFSTPASTYSLTLYGLMQSESSITSRFRAFGGVINTTLNVAIAGSNTNFNSVADVNIESLTINNIITGEGNFRWRLVALYFNDSTSNISNLDMVVTGIEHYCDIRNDRGLSNASFALERSNINTDFQSQVFKTFINCVFGKNLNAFGTRLRVSFIGPNFYDIYTNNDIGSAVVTDPNISDRKGQYITRQVLNITSKDVTQNNVNAKFYLSDNVGANPSSTANSPATINFNNQFSYTTIASGGSTNLDIITSFVKKVEYVSPVTHYRSNSDTSSDDYTLYGYEYGKLPLSLPVVAKGNNGTNVSAVFSQDQNITELNKATVDAYTEIDTAVKFYDRAASHLEDNLGTYLDFIVTRSGNLINAGAYNVTIDATASSAFDITGNLITLKASTFTGDMVTTGLITLANGATFNGVRTDANGTVYPDQPISITNISAGSRMRIYNVTTGTETVNTVVPGTSYTSSYQEGTGYNDGDTVRVYLTKLGKKEWVGDVIDTSNGFSVLAAQVDDDVYVALGIDGSTITKFQADYPNNEVDLIIGSDWTMAELYAWWANNLTTEDGIRNFFGGITAIDQANFKINTVIVDLFLDNTTNASYKQTDNRRFFRDTGTGYPVRNPTTSGYGLDVVWRNTILIAQTEGGTSDLSFVDVKRAVRQALSPKDKAVIIKKAR